ncbi:MAG: MarR family transcriptional regulator [Candidatus Omnitrophica bacterium]|nr:MarR family transcriptional regulator [Candidatus Omnitrophota bacterium]
MREMQGAKCSSDFSAEVSKILPLISREYAQRQQVNIFSKINLTVAQMFILEYLKECQICKMSQLAKALNLTMSAATANIDKLVSLRLVKREHSTKDRRVVRVTILNKGKEMNRKVTEARCSCLNELFTGLNEQDKDDYLRILRKMYNNLRKEK